MHALTEQSRYVFCATSHNFTLLPACTRLGSEFALQPLSVVVMEGQSAVLTCALAGIGTIQWTFEAATIPRTSSLNTTISRNSSLFAVTRNDTYSELRIARADHLRHSGYYQCVDDSGYVSIPAQVRVLCELRSHKP